MSSRLSFFYGLILSSLLLASCAGLLPVPQSTAPANPTTAAPTTTSTTTPTPAPLDLSAALSELTGVVELKNPDQSDFSAAFDGMRLVLQGQVRTGSNGRARLDLSSGTIVRMAPATLFTLQENEEQDGSLLTRLMMEAGEIWIILNSGRMDVETPSGTASVRGSFLHVRVDPFSSDVQVTCLEGACQAENPNAAVEMVSGEGAALIAWDPAGSAPPPPPKMYYLSQNEIDNFVSVNPEAQAVMPDVVATVSALPPLPPTLTAVPPSSCFALAQPAYGEVIPSDENLVFDWEDQPSAYKYVLTITRPDLVEKSWIAWNSSSQVEASVLEMVGIYQWSVTALDANLQPICSAGPWAFTQPGVLLSTPTAQKSGDCISLLAPASGVNFPGPARVDFNWSEYSGAYKYAVTFRPPTGGDVTFMSWKPPYTRYVESFIEGGTYQWWVTVKNNNLQEICSSQVFTFTKPKTILTTPTAVGDLFWERQGPSGAQTSCASLHFSVKSSNPSGGMIKVVYSPNNVPEGSTDPNIVIGAAGSSSGSGDLTLPNKGQTKYWRFAIFKDGVYTLDSQIFNFTCPSPTVNTQPPSFSNQSGPTGTQSSCSSLNFSVKTVNPTGGMIKMIYSTNSTPDGNVDPHIVLGNSGATSGSGSLSLADDGKTYFWRFAIYDGTYIHDPQVYSFNCPMPASQGPSFTAQSGPTGVQSSCSALGFSVDTTLSGTIKLVYSKDPSTLASIPAYFAIGTGPGSGTSTQDFSSYSGKTVYYVFSVYNGTYTLDTNTYSFSCP